MILLPEQTDRRAMDEALDWSSVIDEKDLSDAAREWADTDLELATQDNRVPESRGEMLAMLEVAFEAGRFYQIRAGG